MQKFAIWLISALFVFINFDWFLGVIFDIYDALTKVFNSYSDEYKILAIGAACIYLLIIIRRID